jgi:multiple sugar transport system substrate-binding protein
VDPASAGYKAMEFEINALKEGLIDPASTGLTDVQVQENFKTGQASVDLAGWAGNLAVYNDSSKSKVAGQVVGVLMPSTQGKSRSFALPEALGVPANAKNKDAAVAFIKWYLLPENQAQAYAELSNLPTRSSVLNKLTKEGKLASGAVLVEQIKGAGPLFAQGTPTWYPALSRSVSEAINQAAKGRLTVAQVVKKIADDAAKAMQE